MAFKMSTLVEEIYFCPDCRCWDQGKAFTEGETYQVYLIGPTSQWDFGTGKPIDMYTEMVLCEKHRAVMDSTE